MFRVVGRIVAFVAIVLVTLGVLSIGASAIGFLVYSDRPGPGFYGLRLALDLAEARFLVSFLGFLVVPVLFVGFVVLAVELFSVRLCCPRAAWPGPRRRDRPARLRLQLERRTLERDMARCAVCVRIGRCDARATRGRPAQQ